MRRSPQTVEPKHVVRAMEPRKIEVARPCYSFRRSRAVTRVTVYDVKRDRIVEEHSPYNCLKAYVEEGVEGETIVIEFNPSKHAVFYRYRTTSNRGIIILYHLPPGTTPEALADKIKSKFQYREVYVQKARVAKDRYQILYCQHYYLPL
jgi:hypothetical protein